VKLGMEVDLGLGPGHIVLDGDPAPPKKGYSSPHFFGNFGLCIVAKRLDGSRCPSLGTEVGLGPGHIVSDGDPAHPPPKRAQQPPIFGLCLFWPDGWMDQDATWQGNRPRSWPHCVRWGPTSPPKGAQPSQFSVHVCCGRTAGWIKMPLGTEVSQFSAHVCCGRTAGWIKMPLGTEVGLGPDDIVLDGDPAPPLP